MREFKAIEIGDITYTEAMEIENVGCLVRTMILDEDNKDIEASVSVCFVPGVRIIGQEDEEQYTLIKEPK